MKHLSCRGRSSAMWTWKLVLAAAMTVRGIADRNLHQRVAMDGPQDEIKDLADTLDGMLGRLDRAFDSQQRFIANAAHELRTPLAINRTLIEVAMLKDARPESPLTQVGSTLLAVNRRHEMLIDGLLMLAGSEQQIADPQDVDIVHNLVDNALRYNLAADGWVQVSTGQDPQGRAMLAVENSGPVIPAYEVPRLFEPFRRLSSTERLADQAGVLRRRGAGLGLSIVQAIADSHRGEVQASAREQGGLVIRVLLPAADRAAG